MLRAGAAWSHWRLTEGRPRGNKGTPGAGGCSCCYKRSTGGSGGQESRGRGDSDGVEVTSVTSVTSAQAVSGHEVGEAVDVVTDLSQGDLGQHEHKRGWSLQHDMSSQHYGVQH